MRTATDISRRRFLGSAVAAAGANVALPRASASRFASADAMDMVDVAVVGAGLSGLCAARELVARGVTNIRVLEARDRVGGRTVNVDLGQGQVAEGGGQWVGPTQTAILDLCKALGVGTFPTYVDGNAVYHDGSGRLELPYAMIEPGPTRLTRRIDRLAKTVPLNAPWNAEQAAQWDAMSLADWMQENVSRQDDRTTLQAAAALTLSTTPDQLSFLYFLYYVHSAGSLHTLESIRGGAQDSRIVGGSQILCTKMADELGDKVWLGAPIQKVSQTSQHVTLETDRRTIRARAVIMAVMPGSCARMQFEPALPPSRRQLQAKWIRKSTAVKLNVVYAKPFWRDKGLSGIAFGDAGPVPFTVDNSPPDGTPGVILVLTSNDDLDKAPDARKAQVLEGLAAIFGDEARHPIGYHETNWSDEQYTAGCVSPLAPGVLTQYGASLRPSVGRIHWAGTETAEVWTGYMDGAVRAGKRVAAEVAAIVS